VGCLHAYSAASNGDYYGAEKAVDCAAQLIVQCAEDEFEALFPKFQPSRVTITTCSNARSLSPHFQFNRQSRVAIEIPTLAFCGIDCYSLRVHNGPRDLAFLQVGREDRAAQRDAQYRLRNDANQAPAHRPARQEKGFRWRLPLTILTS